MKMAIIITLLILPVTATASTNISSGTDVMMQMIFGLPFLFAVIIFGMWFVYGKDERVIGPVEAYPPKGYNSAETGFLYKGKADTQDVASLLIYLANRGYIRISETQERSLFSTSKGFKITKLNEYKGDNPNERLFLNGLFNFRLPVASFRDVVSLLKNPSSINDDESAKEVTEVTIHDLKYNFYITLNSIIANMNRKENRENIFEKSSLNKRWRVVLMCLTSFLLITVRPMLEFYEDPSQLLILLFPGIGFTILFLSLCTDAFKTMIVNGVPTTKRRYGIIFGLIFGLFFGGVPFAFMVLPALMINTAYLVAFLTGMTCIVIMLLFDKNMKKRTRLGNELLGQIKGFKQFLETAEKHRLELLVRDSSDYFYNVMPYAYVLGIQNVLFKKFEGIGLKQPRWYSGIDNFNYDSFVRFINSMMKSTASVMASSPPRSSDSSSD